MAKNVLNSRLFSAKLKKAGVEARPEVARRHDKPNKGTHPNKYKTAKNKFVLKNLNKKLYLKKYYFLLWYRPLQN